MDDERREPREIVTLADIVKAGIEPPSLGWFIAGCLERTRKELMEYQTQKVGPWESYR